MKVTVDLEFGSETCAEETSRALCRMVRTHDFLEYVCVLFDGAPLFDRYGWLERCLACRRQWPSKEAK